MYPSSTPQKRNSLVRRSVGSTDTATTPVTSHKATTRGKPSTPRLNFSTSPTVGGSGDSLTPRKKKSLSAVKSTNASGSSYAGRAHPGAAVKRRSSSLPHNNNSNSNHNNNGNDLKTEIRVPLSARRPCRDDSVDVPKNNTNNSNPKIKIVGIQKTSRRPSLSASFLETNNNSITSVEADTKPWLRPATKGILKKENRDTNKTRRVRFDEGNVRRTSSSLNSPHNNNDKFLHTSTIDRTLHINLDNVDVAQLADSPSKQKQKNSKTLTTLHSVQSPAEWDDDSDYFNKQFGITTNNNSSSNNRRSSSPVLFHETPPPPMTVEELSNSLPTNTTEDGNEEEDSTAPSSGGDSPLLAPEEPAAALTPSTTTNNNKNNTGYASSSYVDALTQCERRLLRALVMRNKAAESKNNKEENNENNNGQEVSPPPVQEEKKKPTIATRHADPTVVQHIIQKTGQKGNLNGNNSYYNHDLTRSKGFMVVSTRGGNTANNNTNNNGEGSRIRIVSSSAATPIVTSGHRPKSTVITTAASQQAPPEEEIVHPPNVNTKEDLTHTIRRPPAATPPHHNNEVKVRLYNQRNYHNNNYNAPDSLTDTMAEAQPRPIAPIPTPRVLTK
ncbi:hypothetical protein ADEAN_000603100 [Angomonas deanei]|uniref:Uncharacterized protein n=1 Tax=Angomonas deanei TaxID=59799 RepID=A0A7G2CJV3_9TRYP|nr:hypothetical protein ADEAN_000603100 [Angomonas deanei]